MFEWLFRPTCPCDAAAKSWVEQRLRWLSRQFGLHLMIERPMILPVEEFFPDPWDGSPKAAKQMFHRVMFVLVIEPEAELPGIDAAAVRQEFRQLGFPRMPVNFAGHVNFDAIARRQQDRLAVRIFIPQRRQGVGALLRRKRQPLAHLQRRGLVI